MSLQYDQYLAEHGANIRKGFEWIREHLPDLLGDEAGLEQQICLEHDRSKTLPEEYDPYDVHFYGGEPTPEQEAAFGQAWQIHYSRNPHHWQHWVEGETVREMPRNYVLEMVCDWWSFGWAKGNLYDIFSWYERRNAMMKLHPKTRALVESILGQIKGKLDA